METVLKEALEYAIYLGVITLVPFLIYAIKTIGSALVDYVITKSNNEAVNQILLEITAFTEDAVACTMQTYVDKLKKEGTFTKEAQEEAFKMSLETAEKFISEESKELFEAVYGGLEEYLKVLIEAKVKELKTLSSIH